MPAQTIIKLRRGTATEWATANPVLAAGEAGVETDTNQLKIGDGTTNWNSAPYITGGSGASTIVSETEPAATIEGGLWYKASTQRLYIYIDGTGWALVPTEGIIAQDTEPGNTDILWLDTDEPGDAVLPLGGTTGQVLSKIDGSDYNTEWSDLTASDITDVTATAAELNILDGATVTTAELNTLDGITASAAALNTIDDGTAGFTALSNGTAGISYQPVSHNYIINGAFDVWQRGNGPFTTNVAYTADRWLFFPQGGGTGTVTRETFTPAELNSIGLGDAQHYLKMNMTTSAPFNGVRTRLEDVRTLAGQTVTISFWAKGVNPSTGSWILDPGQVFGGGGSPITNFGGQTFSVTSSWQRFSLTFTAPSISGKTIGTNSFINIEFRSAASSTSAASELSLWGVQLEAGSVATPFKRHAPDVGLEKVACKRYFQVFGGGHRFARVGSAFAFSSTQFRVPLFLPVEMRATPSLNPVPVGSWRIESNGLYAISSFALDSPNAKSIGLNCAVTGATIGFGGQLTASDDLNARIYLDAEI